MTKVCKRCGANNEDDARFCGNCGKRIGVNPRSIHITLLYLLVAVFLVLFLNYYSDYNFYCDHSLYDAEDSLGSLREEYADLAMEYSRLSDTYPIIITDIEIANVYRDGEVETDYGERIYSYRTMLLKPRIEYTGFVHKEDLKFYVKLITPDGRLSHNDDTSPKGYTYSDERSVYEGDRRQTVLAGWGNSTKGNWEEGEYTIEIWYNDVCLKSKKFTIY
ncbi:MAG: zinc ribbon domain-containing protein [Bacteroidales bacterium]|nr:zinc ribbon domain-containing protein [Bacteroidales bacterium]